MENKYTDGNLIKTNNNMLSESYIENISSVPSSYMITYLASKLSNWVATQSITLPSSDYTDEHSIEVYLN